MYFDYSNGDEVCPDGWEYSGSYYGYAVCWTRDQRSVVNLYYGADDTYHSGPDVGAEVCGADWEFLGDVGGAAVCAH